IAAFETALERDPDNAAAARNLEIARAILAYVETAREQSDTGEQAGIGADDVVYDNEEARGTETQDRGEGDAAPQSAEQWMRSVDTRTADFLRSRFALENAAGARAAAEGQGTE
ncbi:MAG: VWA domain-containing protein, partial [Pseudomonadota bacterium]